MMNYVLPLKKLIGKLYRYKSKILHERVGLIMGTFRGALVI
jgi:hypothetical protein